MTNEQEVLELAKKFCLFEEGTFAFNHSELTKFAQAIRDQEAAKREQEVALYRAEAERIWVLMPELRNTDSHYELFEAVHEKLRQEAAKVAMLVEVLDKARNGIVWYSENSDDADDSDTEMLCEIDAILVAAAPEAEAFIREKQAEVMPKWQPIETAPKHSGDVLLFAGNEIFCAWWSDVECGWVFAASASTKFIVKEPTHWMPLPAVPELRNAKE